MGLLINGPWLWVIITIFFEIFAQLFPFLELLHLPKALLLIGWCDPEWIWPLPHWSDTLHIDCIVLVSGCFLVQALFVSRALISQTLFVLNNPPLRHSVLSVHGEPFVGNGTKTFLLSNRSSRQIICQFSCAFIFLLHLNWSWNLVYNSWLRFHLPTAS